MRRIEFYLQSSFFRVFYITLFLMTCLFSASSLLNAANAAEVTLAWDANSEESLDGYKLYYKFDTSGAPYNGTGLYEGDSPVTIYLEDLDDTSLPQYTLSGLGEGQLYHFALTAFDTDGLESDYSDEVSYEVPAESSVHTITASVAGASDSDTVGPTILIEAEDGSTSAPMEAFGNSAASGGEYVAVPESNRYEPDPLADAGYVEYDFSVSETGDYIIWGKVLAADASSDSFYVSVDGGDFLTWHVLETETWAWDVVSERNWDDVRDSANPMRYTLSEGVHTLVIKMREDATNLDKIVITNDLSLDPENAVSETDANPPDGGTISPVGSISVAEGGSQTFSIVADSNYSISDVIVDDSSVGPVSAYSFENVSASHTIEAVFELDTFTVTAMASDGGTISPMGVTTAAYGASLSYTITPDTSCHIADVMVDGGSVGQVTTYTFENITASHTIEVVFEQDTAVYTVAAAAGDGGTISPAGVSTVASGSGLSYTIAPEANYHIAEVMVDGTSVGAVTSYTFENVTASHTITAAFEIDTFTITATAGDGGTISHEGDTSATYATSVSYTITPDASYHIADVMVDGVSVGAVTSYTFENITASHTIEAVFEIDTFTITADTGENGTITPSGIESAAYGSSLSYTITPDDNYHIADVMVDGVSVGPVAAYTFDNISASHTIAAVFGIDTLSITAVSGDGGTISPAGVTTAVFGSSVCYTITPDENYHILDVIVDGGSVGQVAAYTFDNIMAAHTIEAVFEIDTFTITATAGANGTISPEGIANAAYGSNLSYTITPAENHHILDVMVDGASVGPMAAFAFENITVSHTIEAVFEIDTFTVTATASAGGAISPSGTTTVDAGSTVSIVVTPDANYHISDVVVDGLSVGPVTTFLFDSVIQDHSIHAIFSNASTVVLEAESGWISIPMEIFTDSDASGGEYVAVPESNRYESDPLADAGYVEYDFSVSETGDYIIWGKVLAADASSDSFYVSVDGGDFLTWHVLETETWAWDVVSERNWYDVRDSANPMRYTLSEGAHTLVIKMREDATNLDKIVITNDLSLDPENAVSETGTNPPDDGTDTVDPTILIEAEDGETFAPMEFFDDSDASGGEYVMVPESNRYESDPLADAGYVEYDFSVSETGDYIIWGKVLAADASSDSFYVSVDGGDFLTWHVLETETWAWDVVSERNWYDVRDSANPMRYTLSKGAHTLVIKMREDATKLDKIVFTSDLGFIPVD